MVNIKLNKLYVNLNMLHLVEWEMKLHVCHFFKLKIHFFLHNWWGVNIWLYNLSPHCSALFMSVVQQSVCSLVVSRAVCSDFCLCQLSLVRTARDVLTGAHVAPRGTQEDALRGQPRSLVGFCRCCRQSLHCLADAYPKQGLAGDPWLFLVGG